MMRRPSGRIQQAQPDLAERTARIRRGAAIRALLVLWIGSFMPAIARADEAATSHEIVWAHPDERSVARFIVFASAVKGDSARARRIDVGKPVGEASGGVRIFSAIVAIRDSEFVAIAAVGHNGRMGGLSSWSGPPPTRPGQPIVIAP